jgi:hypothetical protein
MKTIMRNGQTYKLPGALNPFQQEMYIHLIDWKWRNITREPGIVRKAGKNDEIIEYEYDAILPESFQAERRWPHLYPEIVAELKRHLAKNDFRIHKHFYHMASSQAANINLFLPVLLHPNANAILGALKPGFATLATAHLDNGYCIEYWGGNFAGAVIGSSNTGPLHDKTKVSGTDSDIAIAYHNHQGELCLWLIEHKLTESEFTACGGFKSRGRKGRPEYDCTRSFSDILANKHTCYYHAKSKFNYWNITDSNRDLFVNQAEHGPCPFQGGLNQLWRNQLLARAIEQDEGEPYKHVSFSVVKHSGNTALNDSLDKYKKLIDDHPSFSTFMSSDVVKLAEQQADAQLGRWASWYRELYNL